MTVTLFQKLDSQVQNFIRGVSRDIIMPAFRINIAEDMISVKNDHSIVTIIDHQAQAFLKPRLMDVLPGSGFLGEEDDLADPRTLRDCEWVWILDPIDGTHNFAYQKPDFGTMLALWHVPSATTAYGWIYMPVKDYMFSGGRNESVYLNNMPLDHTVQSTLKPLKEMRGLLNYNSFGEARDAMSHNSHGFQSIEPSSCAAVKFVDLLLGEADFAAFGRAKIWDLAAGFALLDAANGHAGRIRDPDGMQDLSLYNPKVYAAWYLAVRDKRLWSAVHSQLFADVAQEILQ